MDIQQQVITEYAALRDRAAHMLTQAEGADWAEVVTSAQAYVSKMEKLADLEYDVALDATHQTRKHEMIEHIRSIETQLRGLLDDRMATLSESMSTLMQQNKVEQAYTVT